jgi:hypothetical protein
MILSVEESLKEGFEMRRFFLLITCFAFCFVFSCTKNKIAPPTDLGLDYFPLETGLFKVYELDSIYYNDFTGKVDSFHFQVKEIVGEEFTDGAGGRRFRLERYYRRQITDSWRISDVWSVAVNSSFASCIEENINLVKLSFPAKSGREWNLNAFNAEVPAICRYEFVDSSKVRAGITYTKVLRATLGGDSSLIGKKKSFEEYSRGIGLIYKRYLQVEDRDSVIDFSKPLENRVDYGFDVTYTLIEHGKI